MSEASSGGVCSSVSRIARRISRSGLAIAARTSSLCSWMAVGSPETRWRPRTSIVSSGRSAVADPRVILIVSAVREPIAS